MKFNKIKKYKFTKDHIVLIILFVIFSLNIDLFNKSYSIATQDHDLRQSKIAYDYCEGTGIGYIFYIKKKYNLNKSPKIKNFGGTQGSPSQSWIFNNTRIKDNNKLIVLFNLDQNNQSRFDLSNYNIEDNYKNDCLYLTKK